MKKEDKSNIVIYEGKDGKIELRADIEKDTLWATQDQIAYIFATTKQNIGFHLKNIFLSGELIENSVVKESFTTASDGKRYRARFYNLDVAIAVGYRVNSKKATQFRIWATRTLHEYLVSGYAINRYRLEAAPRGLEDLHRAMEFIESKDHGGALKGKVTLSITRKLTPQ